MLLLEKDHLPRHKVCGEFVSAESLELLSSLLGGGRFADRPQISSGRIFLQSRVVSLPVAPAARSIPRFDLDQALLESARACGVRVEEGIAAQSVERQPGGGFLVRTAGETFKVPAVVNATGRWSQLTNYKPDRDVRWIGLKAHFFEREPAPSVDLYFFQGGYCGVQPVGEHAINAAAMVRADNAASLEQVLAAHTSLWRRSRNWEQVFPAITTSPLYFREPQTEDRGMILAGDAAAFIDPFAGDGISLALQTGKLAADSLSCIWKGSMSLDEAHRRYRAAYRKRFAPAFRNAERLRRLLASPAWIRSPLLGLVARPRIASMVVRNTRAR